MRRFRRGIGSSEALPLQTAQSRRPGAVACNHSLDAIHYPAFLWLCHRPLQALQRFLLMTQKQSRKLMACRVASLHIFQTRLFMFSMDRLRCKELSAVGLPETALLLPLDLSAWCHCHAMTVLQSPAVQYILAAGARSSRVALAFE